MSTKFVVGQKLWFQAIHTTPRYIEITKVGRKWLEVNRGALQRVSLDTLLMDGGQWSSPGQCYLSEQEAKLDIEEKGKRCALYQKLYDLVRNSSSGQFSPDQMRKALDALRSPQK